MSRGWMSMKICWSGKVGCELKVLTRSVDTCICMIVRGNTRYLSHGNVFLSPFPEKGRQGWSFIDTTNRVYDIT